ncbi:hypothetical protein DPEC_G00121720 [Dallia pectoralis]|uniref:Uncharacterized protein n=1 Tax=Dallia pectoralis TaxID=75939 RepID=A0ACC2GQB0_DALPE|nr:hypothetical protein DPEC_G00121720 [Dallia pectoralis]
MHQYSTGMVFPMWQGDGTRCDRIFNVRHNLLCEALLLGRIVHLQNFLQSICQPPDRPGKHQSCSSSKRSGLSTPFLSLQRGCLLSDCSVY